jgi:hypothetical protein
MATTATLVQHVLKANREARSDALKTLFDVWEAEGLELTPAQRRMLPRLTKPATVLRTRARCLETFADYYRACDTRGNE